MSDREHALRILERIDERATPADLAIDLEPGVSDRDFVRTLVFGVLRWRGRLDNAIGIIARRRVEKIDPLALAVLRLGTYQLWFMAVPSYAAVSESVNLAGRLAPRARGFVNAILRRASEATIDAFDPHGDSDASIAIRTSHPLWLVSRWTRTLGRDRAVAVARADQNLSFPDLLVNTRLWTAREALGEIASRGVECVPSDLVPGMIRLGSSTEPVSDLVALGLVHPMDEGSAGIAALVPEGSSTVLDLAAAPGGKSLALALRGHRVVSNDVSLARLRPLRRAFRSMFERDATITVGDGARLPFRAPFETVLVDAPCSATGTIRKNPEVRWRLTEQDIIAAQRVQTDLLISALAFCSSFCLYVTCSLEPEENEDVVEAALARLPEFHRIDLGTLAPEGLQPWIQGGVLRLTPDSGADGFTATGLRHGA